MNQASQRRPRANRSAPAAKGPATERTMLVPRDLPVLFQMPNVGRERVTRPAPEPPPTPPGPPVSEPKSPEVNVIVTSAPPAAVPTTPAPIETPKETTKPVETKAAAPVAPAAKVERKPEPRREKQGTWFDGQGKLITVCFLIALIATIYFARAGREPTPAVQQTAWPETHPGDAAGKGGSPPPATSVEPPILTANPSGGAPKAELLPPIENFPSPTLTAETPPPPAEPSPTPPEEPRTAALPPPVTPAPPPGEAPPPRSSGGSFGGPPPEYPGYPSTSPGAYPPHQFAPPAPTPNPSAAPQNPAAPSPSYSGAGYERTGSGLY